MMIRSLVIFFFLSSFVTAFGQSSSFTSWSISSGSLVQGKISIAEGETKSITFSVSAVRTQSSGGQFNPVNFSFHLRRRPSGAPSTFHVASATNSITSADFPTGSGTVTKTFTVTVVGATPNSGQDSHLREDDEIFLFIPESASPSGFFVAPNSYFVDLTIKAGTAQPPSNVQLTAVSYDQILISWKDNSSNETGFKIQFYNANQSPPWGPWYRYAGANVTKMIVSPLAANTMYSMRVAAYTSVGENYSDFKQVKTLVDDCPADLDLVSATNVYNRKAGETITVRDAFTLQAVSSVQFTAGSLIRFLPGSRVPTGQTFMAKIQACDGSTLASQSALTTEEKSGGMDEESISVFPNPSDGVFRVSFPNEGFMGRLMIHDLYSREVMNEEISETTEHVSVSLRVKPGIYLLRLVLGNRTYMKRIDIRNR